MQATSGHVLAWLKGLPSGLAFDWVKLGLSAIAGWLLKGGQDRWRTRHARRFWRPFLRHGTIIVLGRTLDDHGYERSGLLGIGDAMALSEIRQFLLHIGSQEPEVAFARQLSGDQLKETLILVGGPDVNTATLNFLTSLTTNLRFVDPKRHVVSIHDTSTAPPTLYPNKSDDCGMIIRAKNPFAESRAILILAGSFGHGTLAAARFSISPEFLKQRVVQAGRPLECLVETDVIRDTPQKIRPRILRPLGKAGGHTSAA